MKARPKGLRLGLLRSRSAGAMRAWRAPRNSRWNASRAGAVAAAGVALALSCGPRYTARSALGIDPVCAVSEPSPSYESPVKLGLLHPLDPAHAPDPHNPSERAVFAHVYETLVAVDCRGLPRAALAQSWTRRDGGRRWTFFLRPDARFHDGRPVVAGDVVASWRRAGIGRTGPASAVDSARARPDGALDVYFARAQRDIPLVLARGVFAVSRPAAGTVWPVGSGPWAVSPGGPLTLVPAFGAAGPDIIMARAKPRDARDFVDGAADIFTTRDPAVVDYARLQESWETKTLPWSRVYVLVSPARVNALRASKPVTGLAQWVSDGLAGDAVRVEARGWTGGAWWGHPGACDDVAASVPGLAFVLRGARRAERAILFDRSDPVAADLAGRLVALSADPKGRAAKALGRVLPGIGREGSGAVVSRGVDETVLAPSLWSGNEYAYVLALPAAPADRCEALHDLFVRVPWISPPTVDVSRAVVALVETRETLLVRRPGAGVVIDGRGNALITNAWFPEEELP